MRTALITSQPPSVVGVDSSPKKTLRRAAGGLPPASAVGGAQAASNPRSEVKAHIEQLASDTQLYGLQLSLAYSKAQGGFHILELNEGQLSLSVSHLKT